MMIKVCPAPAAVAGRGGSERVPERLFSAGARQGPATAAAAALYVTAYRDPGLWLQITGTGGPEPGPGRSGWQRPSGGLTRIA